MSGESYEKTCKTLLTLLFLREMAQEVYFSY